MKITAQDIRDMAIALKLVVEATGDEQRICIKTEGGLIFDLIVDSDIVRVRLGDGRIGKSAVFPDIKDAIEAIPQMLQELKGQQL